MKKLYEGARRLGINLSREQLEQFEVYYREMVEWNRKINLTAITDYEEAQVKHFLDSLSVIPYLETAGNILRVIDIGTGAGFPGIPLKIVRPGIKLTLLEATLKKTQFLEHLIDKLKISEVEVINGRAEEIAHKIQYRENYQLALSRALAELAASVELGLPFCLVGGTFIAQKKGDIEQEVRRSARAIETMGGRLRGIDAIEIGGLTDDRKIVIIDKVKQTPEKYPRRAGIPVKRPLI